MPRALGLEVPKWAAQPVEVQLAEVQPAVWLSESQIPRLLDACTKSAMCISNP